MNFTDSQLQDCYERNFAVVTDLSAELRQVRALIGAHDLFQIPLRGGRRMDNRPDGLGHYPKLVRRSELTVGRAARPIGDAATKHSHASLSGQIG